MVSGKGSNRLRRIGARALRVLARTAVAALVLLVCVVVALLLAPVRGGLLRLGLDVADRSLPGELLAEQVSWPRPDRLEIRDLVWRTEATADSARVDTLAHIGRLLLAVDLGALKRRDVRIDSLIIGVKSLDVPLVTAQFPDLAPAAADTAPASPAGIWTAPFPRAGAAPGLPSLDVAQLEFSITRARVAPDADLSSLRGAGAVDLTAGGQPAARLAATGARLRVGGEQPFALDLDSLLIVARYDTTSGWADVDSLDVVVAAIGPPDLAARWRELEPLRATVRGRVRRDVTTTTAALDLVLDAPGAGLLGEAWPAALDAADFATVALRLHADAAASQDSLRLAVAADLTDTPWLERGRLAGRAEFAADAVRDGMFALDSLDVALPGLALTARGALQRGRVEAGGKVAAATPIPLLQAFVPALAGIEAAARLDATVAGTLDAPVVDLKLAGGVREGPVLVPRARIALQGDRDEVRVALRAGGGLAYDGDVWADSLAMDVSVEPALGAGLALPERMAAALSADLRSAGGEGRATVRVHGEFAPDAPLAATVVLDTLGIDYPGLALHGSGRRDTSATTVALAARVAAPCPVLEAAVAPLAGTAYAVDLELAAAGTLTDPRVELELGGSCETPFAVVPQLDLSLRGGRRDLQATLRVIDGLEIGGRVVADSLLADVDFRSDAPDTLPLRAGLLARRGDDRLGIQLAAAADSVLTVRLDTLALTVADRSLRLQAPAVARWDTTARELSLSPLALAGSAGTVDVAGTLGRRRTDVAAALDLELTEQVLQTVAPLPFWSADGGTDLTLSGTVDLAAERETASFGGNLDVDLRPHRGRQQLGANLDFGLAEGERSGLAARFALTLADTAILDGELLWPGRFTLAGGWVRDPEAAVELSVPRQTFAAGLLRRLYPEEVAVAGDLTVAAEARLPLVAVADSLAAAGSGRLEASLQAQNLRLDLPNSSRMQIKLDVALGGTPADPAVGGRVDVLSGFLRIPEIPRNLHPVKGTPLLWTTGAADTLGAGTDSLAGRAGGWGQGEEIEAPPPFVPALDLVVDAPGDLRIRGYGLDVEVAANVRMKRGYDAKGRPGPALDGDAHAVRGTLKFMNRTFTIRNAEVTFTGAVPPNPTLDILLESVIEGTTVRLRVTGHAEDPVIDLTSEPDMDRADIMGVLLFGRPLNDLDADQRGRTREEADPAQQMRDNLAGLALAFGTADLQNSVSSTFGVDIVELGSDSQGGSTLTAGKFISPKILVKYNASLEKSGTYFVTLEYTLTQVFKVVSTYGQGEQESGLELKWERRY